MEGGGWGGGAATQHHIHPLNSLDRSPGPRPEVPSSTRLCAEPTPVRPKVGPTAVLFSRLGSLLPQFNPP